MKSNVFFLIGVYEVDLHKYKMPEGQKLPFKQAWLCVVTAEQLIFTLSNNMMKSVDTNSIRRYKTPHIGKKTDGIKNKGSVLL